jgi:hypothetical protein
MGWGTLGDFSSSSSGHPTAGSSPPGNKVVEFRNLIRLRAVFFTGNRQGHLSSKNLIFKFKSRMSFFVANYAYSVLTQDNMGQPDVAFCFMSGATPRQ